MPEIVADPPDPSCYHLFPGSRIQEFQLLGPDPFSPRGRDPRAVREGKLGQSVRAATRHSQSQAARARSCGPAGQARRRCRTCSTASLICCGRSRRKFSRRLWPRSTRRSVSGSTSCRCERPRMSRRRWRGSLAAVARGEVAPAEGARVARRVCARLRAVLHLERVGRVKSGGSRG
jgi:hypothetical protein